MITQKVINTPKEKVRRLQRALYRAAKANRKRKFGVLYDKVWRWDILMEATKRVLSNKGCPGVDGQTVEEIRTYGVERFVTEIQKELREKTYHPDQVLRKYIPKPNGKLRALGIPTVKDRIIQMAVKLVIEPICEADFQMCSFGYRPKKSAQDAKAVITYIIVGGAKWVLDVDLEAYFDTIPHDRLMVLVQERVHRHCLTGKWQTARLHTLRHELFMLPARLLNVGHRNVLNLPDRYPHRKRFRQAIAQIRKLRIR